MKKVILLFFIINLCFANNFKQKAFNKRVLLLNNLKEELLKEDNTLLKLIKVNNFFNKFQNISDVTNYQKVDYWANLDEFLKKGGGDCEDFAIAKYKVLLDIGISIKNLHLTYVKYKEESHIVLLYKNKNDELVLDNISKKIFQKSKRGDLKFIKNLKIKSLSKPINLQAQTAYIKSKEISFY